MSNTSPDSRPLPQTENASQIFGPDSLDAMVYSETIAIRKLYIEACRRLGQRPTRFKSPIIGVRSVP